MIRTGRISIECALLALIGLGACLAICAQAQVNKLDNFRDLFAAARRLESAEMLSSSTDAKLQTKRRELLFAFAREPKSLASYKSHQSLVKLANDYRLKAYQFVQESSKQKGSGNWFTKVFSFGGPVGSLKGISKADAFLSALTDSYETLGKKGQLTDLKVDQDLAKFQIRGLDMILFVLATDIKYLATENVPILNTAIYRQLRDDKFVSNNNFYEVDKLTDKQKQLLLDYFASRVDPSLVSISESLEHFSDPGHLIIGRLLDSCYSVQYYLAQWSELVPLCGDECSPGKTFSNKHTLSRYDEIGQFCEQFLDAL